MTEAIHDPAYWKLRLREAKCNHQLHQSIYRCPRDVWEMMAGNHQRILADIIWNNDSVLDCGCGWGRLLTLIPTWWEGRYTGVDLSPDFVQMAKLEHPGREFHVGKLEELSQIVGGQSFNGDGKYDWAVMVSIRPMVIRNMGQAMWDQMEREIRKVSKKLLYLEYDVSDKGSIE